PGYQESDTATVDPVFVSVRGLPDLVDSVAEVDVDVNLGSVRGDTQLDGDLVARTAGGSTVTVTLSPTTARVSLKVQPIFEQRTIGLTPSIVGTPAPGYRVGNVTIDPPVVTVTGPKDVVDGLQGLGMDQVDVGGATKDVVQSRLVDRVPNLVADHTSVIVTVSIVPFDTAATFIVAPDISPPAGLTVSGGPYSVTVKVSGPLAQMQALKPIDIKATLSTADAVVGTAPYPVTVTLPAGLKADPIDPLTITLKAASP
ncbi:MAG: CdaR family protein, partial [Tepidiformaceae bacterium]